MRYGYLISIYLLWFLCTVLTGCAEKKAWVWYAPHFDSGNTPNDAQMGYYFGEFRKAGITPVGVDAGESFGSPEGRAIFSEYYKELQKQGYAEKGCMLLQSRGGLQGYTWALENQDKVSCIVAVYPIVTVEDYIGINGMAPHWGVTPAWMAANLNTIDPLHRAGELNFPILHVHGTTDTAAKIDFDRQFVAKAKDATLIEINGQGHEHYSPELFRSKELANFVIKYGGGK